jgi:ADP-heptose:LPS heptosyltransferase
VVAREAAAFRDRFDVALLLRPSDPWAGELVRAAAVPVRLGFQEPATLPYLTDGLPHRPLAYAADQAIALAELAQDSVAGGGRPTPGDGPLVVPTSADRRAADRLLAGLAAGSRPYVLHPGTGWPLKQWPPERWGAVAAGLHDRFDGRPLVTGVAAERAMVDQVVAASGGRAVGLAGRLSLGAFAALLERARVVIASDSGPLHLAAMVGAPVVGLYGPGGPLQAGPWCPPSRRRLVWSDLPCRPCNTMEHAPCGATTNPVCTTTTTPAQVLTAATSLLAAH